MIDLSPYVRPGDGVWWGQGGAEPTPLVGSLLAHVTDYGPITVFPGLTWNQQFEEQLPPDLHVVSYGGLGTLSKASRAGRLEVIPCHYSALPRLFASGHLPSDVALLQVSTPDKHGEVSLGIGVEYAADAIPHTTTLIAEINARMPRTTGGPSIPLSRFAATIETDRPILEVPRSTVGDTDHVIAAHVAELVRDGDTIQLGIGTLPAAILQALGDHRDLGVHSGMITDGVLDLMERGIITGANKEIDRGIVVTGAALGTDRLYRALDTDSNAEYPVEFRPASYTHAPAVLSRLNNLVSINSGIQVDLTGQVGAETRNGIYYGAVGGQVDFSRAASSTGRLSIIALRATSRGESSIVAALDRGVVSTARTDVDAIVTEYGAALLTGCTERERTQRIIAIAAPQFREGLERGFNERASSHEH